MTLAEGSANVVVVNGVLDLVGRLAGVALTFTPRVNRMLAYAAGQIIFGAAIIAWYSSNPSLHEHPQLCCSARCESLAEFMVAGGVFGFGFGFQIASFGVVMMGLFGLEHFHAVQGFISVSGGVGIVVVPIIAGEHGLKQSQ